MTFLEQYKDDINSLCASHKVKHLYAFGSVITEKFNKTSDIDFIVDFDNMDASNYADNYFALKFSLETTLKRKIDLLEGIAIRNPYFLKAILQKRMLIF
jgi:predicted nucleotidyltransferase